MTWPDFSMAVAQGRGRPQEEEDDREEPGDRSLRTHAYQLSGCGLWSPGTVAIVTSKITDHR